MERLPVWENFGFMIHFDFEYFSWPNLHSYSMKMNIAVYIYIYVIVL